MTSLRHLVYFIALGMFWGVSPSLYKHWGEIGMPATHVIVLTGLGVGVALAVICRLRGIAWRGNARLYLFGLGCAVLMNVPFGLGLILARYVPATEFALIYSTSPLVNYVVALVTRRENATPRRLLAILLGFASTAILILTRQGTLSGEVSWWLVACLSMPLLYTAYNWFATLYWPANEHPFAAGVWESVWSGLLVVPVLLLVAPPWGAAMPEAAAYWTVVLAGLMWVVERISFFTLIREKGAVFTVQAVYLSTPAAVLFAVAFFGGSDIWLWISLAILMAALYLNNTGSAVRVPVSAGS